MTTPTWICMGTGGVGKTTISAAIGTAFARLGQRSLVATIDPARRLGDLFGFPDLTNPREVPDEPRLSVLATDSRAGARALVEELLAGAPQHRDRVGASPLLGALSGGLSGMHELVALAELARCASDYEVTVIDAAPGRHAIEVLALPRRLAEIIDGRTLGWLGELARLTLGPRRGFGARLLHGARHWIVRALSSSIGPRVIDDALGLLAFAADVRPQLSTLIASASHVLEPSATTVVIVTTAREGAVDHVERLKAGLAEVGHAPALVIVNRVPDACPRDLTTEAALAPWMTTVHRAAAELDAARDATSAIVARAAGWGIPVIQIPMFSADSPTAVVGEVAAVLAAAPALVDLWRPTYAAVS